MLCNLINPRVEVVIPIVIAMAFQLLLDNKVSTIWILILLCGIVIVV
jgi:hypothetical protein